MEGREEVEDDERPGCPSTSKTKENVEKISEIVDLRVKQLIKSTTLRSWPKSKNEWGKMAEFWKKSWILHQDNLPAHNILAAKQFLAD